jgi:hypothetical protein
VNGPGLVVTGWRLALAREARLVPGLDLLPGLVCDHGLEWLAQQLCLGVAENVQGGLVEEYAHSILFDHDSVVGLFHQRGVIGFRFFKRRLGLLQRRDVLGYLRDA